MPENLSYRDYLKPETVSRLKNMALRARLVVEGFITGLHQSPYHTAKKSGVTKCYVWQEES